jgi:NAD(P)-dependent dehydrogenase (short-subunit alcohol dehydrogenase family)
VDLQLSDKIAVITGGASGMGRAIALELAAEGATVAIADLNLTGAQATATDATDKGYRAFAYRLDVTDRSSWQQLVSSVTADHGRIDVLGNVAGPGAKTGHLDTDDDEWNRQLTGHLTGVFLGCQTVLPGMMERRYGKIINMCSFTAHGFCANIPGYGAAFGGILAYTKDLARFAAPHNVNVNCVSPGNIETAMTRDGWLDQPGAMEQLREMTPIGRVGQPEDVSGWFAFLASDRAQHAVGIEVNVSGGQLLT